MKKPLSIKIESHAPSECSASEVLNDNDTFFVKELKGYSGCKIYIMQTNGKPVVRKISSNPQYNIRLEKQCRKQSDYARAHASKIIQYGIKDGLFFFDMEYVKGCSFAEHILKLPISELSSLVNGLFELIDTREQASTEAIDIVKQKIDSLRYLQDSYVSLKPAFAHLDACDWSGLGQGECHGDLTFENIMVSESGDLKLIDFLDSFLNSATIDAAKILQELLLRWSYRNQMLSLDDEIKLSYARDVFINRLSQENPLMLVNSLDMLLLNVLRIYPYLKDKKTETFLDKAVSKLLNKGKIQ